MNLRTIILNNFWWKLLSVFFAVAIWSYIRAGIQDEVIVKRHPSSGTATGTFPKSFPIRVLADSGDKHSYRVVPAEVEVIVTGETAAMNDLLAQEIQVFVDMTDVEPESASAKTNDEFAREIKVHTPAKITVQKVNPPTALVKRLPASPVQPTTPQSNP